MRQNILGFGLFILIVGVSVVVSGYFYTASRTPAAVDFEPEVKRTCFNKRYPNERLLSGPSVTINQAVLDKNTNKLTTEFSVFVDNNSSDSPLVLLHYFVKSGSETRFVATEKHRFQPGESFPGKSTGTLVQKIDWKDKTREWENIYLNIEIRPDVTDSGKSPVFDENKAISVLIANQKK